MKKLLAVLTASALALSLAACSGADSSGSSAAASGSASQSEAASNSASAEGASYRIAIVQQMDHSSLDEIRAAIEAELDARAAADGITIEYQEFNGQNDATMLNQIGTQVVSDGYDAIIPISAWSPPPTAISPSSTPPSRTRRPPALPTCPTSPAPPTL